MFMLPWIIVRLTGSDRVPFSYYAEIIALLSKVFFSCNTQPPTVAVLP